MQNKNKPNFLIVGAAKSGTTSLHHYMCQHDQVFMPELKEPQFFVSDKIRGSIKQKFIDNEHDYFELFSNSEEFKCRGEASVFYLYYYKESIKKILQYLGPNTRIIILLRNPIERAFSAYKHVVSANPKLFTSFDQALMREEDFVHQSTITPMTHFKRMGLYYEMVKSFKYSFPHVHVMLQDDLKDNPDKALSDVWEFLEITKCKIDFSKHLNKGRKEWKFNWLGSFIMNKSNIKDLLQKIPFLNFFKKIILKNLKKNFKPMKKSTRIELIDYYKKDLKKLSNLLNRDLSNWLNTE